MPRRGGIAVRVTAVCTLGLALAFSTGAEVEAQERRACEGFGAPRAPSADLYCMELVPTPDVRGVSGTVELSRARSPFGLAVSVEGNLRYRPVMTLDGLPDPSELGDYTTYVAWASTPVFFPLIRLGEVGNGTTALSEIDLNKFVIMVSAERSAEVTEREGMLVLRAQSPSTRMQPADLMEFMTGIGSGGAGHDHRTGETDGWVAPPMPEGLTMLPAMMELRPAADLTPYLPRDNAPENPPLARPRGLVELNDGDTLSLEAGFVRREVNGRVFVMYGFNGQYPGPLLRVPQEATVTVRFRNSIDWPTAIHWHGLRLDNRFDGVPFVTQDPVQPGEEFTYELYFPDAGIYWYHPHHREEVTQDMGLYGNMLVISPRSDYYSPTNSEELLMLDDLLIGEEGLVPFGLERSTHAMMGRFGNVFLVNGEPDYALEVERGEVVRFFLTNVSNTRTFNLSFDGAPMKVVGSDVGTFEREEWVESVVIAPAERYVVHVRFPGEGSYPIVNRVQGIDHLYGSYRNEVDTLGTVRAGAEAVGEDLRTEFETLRDNVETRREIDEYRPDFDRPVDRELELTLATRDLPPFVRRLMEFDSVYFNPAEWSGTMPMMNWASTPAQVDWILRDPATGEQNMAIDWQFEVGDVVKLRLHNSRDAFHAMQHPLHIHGQRFLVLSQNGVESENLVWKDTTILPVGSTTDILLEITNPGRWMIHCHIAEHLESGMKMVFTVR